MITSVKNQAVKDVEAVMKKGRAREEMGLFAVEGAKMFFEAPVADICKAYVTPGFFDRYREELKAYTFEMVSDDVLKRMSDTVTPQGVVALVRIKKADLKDLKKKKAILILDGVQDPGNLGTMLRSAEGAGFDGIICSDDTVDVYNPKTVRSTMGSVFRIPVVYTEKLTEVISDMRGLGTKVYAACLEESMEYTGADCKGAVAFVVGNESKGVRPETVKACDGCVRIPMEGRVESLNASIAATLLMYEAHRQRAL